jgi:AcrR family transcriptional regulator
MPALARTPRTSWIDAGLRALSMGGPEAIRIDVLAQELGVTRGGFYGYFGSRDAFLEEMLDEWERRCIVATVERVEKEGGDARKKVWRAGMLTFSKDLVPVDLAVRDWARHEKSVAKRLRRVDNRRMEYLRELIGGFCTDQDEIEARSLLAFSLAIGNHFIAADHGGRSRRNVLELAKKYLLDMA